MTVRAGFRIYGPTGMVEQPMEAVDHARRVVTGSDASRVAITEIMSRNVVCARPDLPISALTELMVTERLGCVPVVDDNARPVGMVTKLDLVEQTLAGKAHPPARVGDVMMPLAITLQQDATVAQAAALMASDDMHHVMIVDERRLVGVVSTMDITRWLAAAGAL